MDPLSAAIAGAEIPVLTEVAKLLHGFWSYTAVVIALVLLVSFIYKEWKRIWIIFLVLILTVLISEGVKAYYFVERPCMKIPGKVACPEDGSLPSGHAIVAFGIAIASIGKKDFYPYFLFALFVSFSRVYLGVHTLVDIGASISLAFLAYVVVELIIRNFEGKI